MLEPLDEESKIYIKQAEDAQFSKTKEDLEKLEAWRARSEAESRNIYLG